MSVQSENVGPAPLLEPFQGRRSGYGHGPKRALDLSVVLVGALPVLLAVALLALVVAGQGGRPFYRQLRVGRDGRQFWMYKLRTMRPDAEVALASLLAADPEARAEWARAQKLRTDPRITRLGRFLRKTSLDELPQLWNVAKGDMSLVGPRPMMPEQQGLYPGEAYFRLRPGITGLWQVSERNRTSFAERAEFDTAYAEALSLRTDLGIFLRTVQVVLKGTGY